LEDYYIHLAQEKNWNKNDLNLLMKLSTRRRKNPIALLYTVKTGLPAVQPAAL
jgi:hypothetical protein